MLNLSLGLNNLSINVLGIATLSMTGLNTNPPTDAATPGDHASISVGFPSGVTAWTSQAWGVGSYGDTTYGTGASPTDYTASDGQNLLWEGVGDDGETYRAFAPIRYAVGTAPAVADGQSWVVDVTAVNLDGSASGASLTFSYAISGVPSDITINSSTGAITGTLDFANSGASGSGTATVTATDQYGRELTDTFTWSYALRTQATGGADLDLSFPEDSAITATDLTANWTLNGNTLTYAIVTPPALPTGLSVDSAGEMTGTPTTVTADDTYTLRGTDEYGRTTDDTFTLEITAVSVATISGTTADTYWGTIAQHGVELTGAYPGGSTAQWQQRPAGSSDPWVDVPVGGTSAAFTPDIGVNCTYGYELAVYADGDTATRSAAYVVRYSSADFVLTIEIVDHTVDDQFTLPFRSGGTYSGTANMGDGNGDQAFSAYNDPLFSAIYISSGIKTIRVSGSATAPLFDGFADAPKVRTVETFGDLGWVTMLSAFSDCSGMTSFTAGNTDTSAIANWYNAWGGCSSMTTCDITGMSFAACTNLSQTWSGCVAMVEPFDFTVVSSTGAQPGGLAECFFGIPSSPDLPNLDPSGLDITGLNQLGGYTGGFFNFLNNRNLSTAIYDQTLINFAAQLPFAGIDPEAGEGWINDFQLSQPTMGGAVETARAQLINAGFYIEDAETTDPDQMAAPGLTVNGQTQITISRGARPFSGGLPIRFYDYRYRETGGPTWTEVSGTVDDLWTSKVLSSLTAGTEYEVQIRARAAGGGTYIGAWSASATATTSASGTISGEEDGQEPVITVDDSNPNALSFTVTGTTNHDGTYTQNKADSDAAITTTTLSAAPACLALPSQTGPATAGSAQTGIPGLWVYAGADPGDQTFEWYEDGVASGDTDLSFTPAAALSTPGLVLKETFDGVTVDSAAVTIAASGGPTPYEFTDNNDGTVTLTTKGTSPTPTFTDNNNGTVTKDT